MELKKVHSSNVAAVGYDPSTQILRVEFKSGGSYDYANVDPVHAAQIQSAPSIGGYIARHIKPHHKATRVSA